MGILKIEIDLNDMWTEEDSLQDGIVTAIKDKLHSSIWKSISDQSKSQIRDEIARRINDDIQANVHAQITDFIEKGEVYGGKTVKEYLHDQLANRRTWQQTGMHIERVAKEYSEETKKQYDMLFATKIVMNLKDSGMLS